MEQDKKQDKTVGQTIDELLNNPTFMMEQCSRIVKEANEEAEKITNENRNLQDTIIKKDKEILYLKGKIEGMQDIIRGLNLEIKIQ